MDKVLVVDDEWYIRKSISDLLTSLGYQVFLAENGDIALNLIEKENPDIILMDVDMPGMDGITTIKKVRERKSDSIIIMLTAYSDEQTMKECAHAGADDFLTKPASPSLLSARLALAKKAKTFYSFQNAFVSELKEKEAINRSTIHTLLEENTNLSLELLARLNFVAECRDYITHEHVSRVSELSYALALTLDLSPEYCYSLKLAAPLHDLGKIGIPDAILLKPGKLTSSEFEKMKEHTTIGWKILRNSRSSVLKIAETVALTHHERWDGSGYPQGLKEKDIPIEGRIVGIADAIDAMFSKRPYKGSMPENQIREELIRCQGTQFDPLLVDKILPMWPKVLEIYHL